MYAPAADVLREPAQLVAAGVKELLVISQDTSAYGVDLKYATYTWRGHDPPVSSSTWGWALATARIWVRLHYVYPHPHVDDVIPLMAGASCCLISMLRFQTRGPWTLEAYASWPWGRKACSSVSNPSGPDHFGTFIVVLVRTGVTDFAFLLDWLDEAQSIALGCFAMSRLPACQQ